MSRSIATRKSNWRWLALALLWVSAAALGMGEERRLQTTLYDYASAFRWGEMNQILSFFDRAEGAAAAPTTFELERWKQWRVVGYRAQPFAMSKDGHAEQIVEIEVSNVNTLATRTLLDRQKWRYERKTKAWLLTTGLPKLSQS
jgi:hypothetical protein